MQEAKESTPSTGFNVYITVSDIRVLELKGVKLSRVVIELLLFKWNGKNDASFFITKNKEQDGE